MPETHALYIGGEWVEPHGRGTFDDLNPFDGELFARAARSRREDARRAVEAAAAAFPAWRPRLPGSAGGCS